MTALELSAPILTSVPPAILAEDMAQSLRELDDLHGLSAATRKAYKHDWQAFVAWCQSHNYPAFPAPGNVVAAYANERAKNGEAYAYICRSIAAISQLHRRGNQPNPRKTEVVRATMANIARRNGVAQRQVEPLMIEDIRKMLTLDGEPTLRDYRNRALILVAYMGAFRRSEVAALRWDNIAVSPEGVDILVQRSKTDQYGRGHVTSIPYCQTQLDVCAVRALLKWKEVYTNSEWVFPNGGSNDEFTADKPIGGRDIARIVKALCEHAGLPSEHYSGHSLRAGLATQAARKGVNIRTIQRQTGHAQIDGALLRYIRAGNRWDENVVKEMGL